MSSLLSVAGKSLALLAGLGLGLGQGFDDLAEDLRGDDSRARRSAVQGLAKLDTEEAWDLVIELLADPEPNVADEAQLALRGLSDPELLSEVLGKRGLRAKRPLVRERAAQLLGHVDLRLDAKALGDGLKDKEPAVRAALARTVERHAQAADNPLNAFDGDVTKLTLKLMQLLEGDRDPRVRAAAAMAYFEIIDFSMEGLVSMHSSPAPEIFIATAMLLAPEPAPAEPDQRMLELALGDPHSGMRCAVMEGLASRRDRDSVARLVKHLEVEPRPRLRWRLVELLRGLSGLEHGLDPRPWRDWVQGLDGDWAGAEPNRERADPGEVSAALAGLPLLSDRLVILVDLSGSVWEERADGRTRKDLIDDELERALHGLPEGTRFNLIVYTDEPKAFDDELVELDAKSLKKAMAWFRKRRDRGVGDLWSALDLALADPEIDTVVVLSDGSPSGGDRWNLGLMSELFADRNRFRRIALDAVLTDPSPSIVHYWERMTAESGGRMQLKNFAN